mgnify:CR=1 FL=1
MALFVFFLLSPGIFAQLNFSGNWSFNESKSKFGEGAGGPGGRPPMAATAMSVTQDASVLTVNQTMNDRDGQEFQTVSKFNLDGSETENAVMMDRIRKSVLTWSADKKSFTINSTMSFERDGETREIKTSEKWSLSSDGKTLMIESTRPTRDGGTRTNTLAYDRK